MREVRIENRSIHSVNGAGKIQFAISASSGIIPLNPIILGISQQYLEINIPKENNAITNPPNAMTETRL